MLAFSALAVGLLTRFAPLSTPPTRCGVPCMLYDRGQDSGAEMDEAKVRTLLMRRAELQRAKDYSGADAVRAELLKDMDVTVWDRDQVWMHGTGDTPPTKGRTTQPKERSRERSSERGSERSGERSRSAPRSERSSFGNRIFVENLSFETEWTGLKDHFAAAGYPVAYASVSYDREAQRSKGQGIVQFETADAMEHALSDEGMTGTTLDGRALSCRPDAKSQPASDGQRRPPARERREGEWGDTGGQSRGGERERGERERGDDGARGARGGGRRAPAQREFNEFGHDYSRHEADRTVLDGATEERVHRLLWQRLEAKLSRDFGRADQLLAELGGLGVSVADKARQWRADGTAFDRGYTRVAGDPRAGPGGQVDSGRVDRLLEQRGAARRRRDFRGADDLRDELRDLGIEVDDQERTWWLAPEYAGAEAAPEAERFRPPRAPSGRSPQDQGGDAPLRPAAVPYRRSPNCRVELSTDELGEIEDLVAQRHAAKRRRTRHGEEPDASHPMCMCMPPTRLPRVHASHPAPHASGPSAGATSTQRTICRPSCAPWASRPTTRRASGACTSSSQRAAAEGAPSSWRHELAIVAQS